MPKFIREMNTKGITLLLALTMLMVACTSGDSETTTSESLENVKIQFDWIHTVEYAGFYIANADNHYADKNLSVEFIINDGSVNSIDRLVNGEADFIITGADTLLLAREQGKDVVAIATIYQVLPLGFMSLPESNIITPQDLSGRSVMLSMNRTSEYALRAMVNATGVDISTIDIIPRTSFTDEALFDGEVDVIDTFVTNQVVQLRRSNVDVNLILPLDYGVEMYVNVIATTQKTIDEKPELVARFVDATIQGLQTAVADAEKATQITLEMNPDLNPDSELESMRTSLALIQPTGSQPGQMNPSTWAYVHDMLLEQGLLSAPLDVEAAYNLSFLEQIYSQ